MPRALTVAAQAQADQKLGTEPIIVIKIDWDSGAVCYADKATSFDIYQAKAAILQFSPISQTGKQDQTGSISSASVILDDSDGTLKTLVDTETLEGRDVTIYQHWIGLTSADALVLLKGKLTSDIVWNEGQRTLSFEVESIIEENLVGYAPEEGDIANLQESAIGKPWPLSFGTVLKVPTMRIKSDQKGWTKSLITYATASFEVDKGRDFPQGVPITIRIDNVYFEGSFSGDVFTPTSNNAAIYTNVTLAAREVGQWQTDPSVIWLTGSENLVGRYCIVNHPVEGWMVNRCKSQVGKRCHFYKAWRVSGTLDDQLLDETNTLAEVARYPRTSWSATWTQEGFILGYGYTFVTSMIIKDSWQVVRNIPVWLVTDYDNLYICNLLASTEILDVWGYRKLPGTRQAPKQLPAAIRAKLRPELIDQIHNAWAIYNKLNPKREGETELVQIPSSYYVKNLSNSIAGKTVTTLEFNKQLEDYDGENWSGDVYVSLRSSVGSNTADIIKWLIETYATALTVDAVSFAAVATKLTNYPSNFTLFDQQDVMKLCQEIAWQARCAIYIKNSIVYIKYLSEIPVSPDTDIDTSKIELKTLELSFTSKEDILNKLTATWNRDYGDDEDSQQESTFQNDDSINMFGTKEDELNFFIYNIQSLIEISLDFWGYRYSYAWRKAKMRCMMPLVRAEMFDTIAHNLDIISTNSLRGVVEAINHDSARPYIDIETIIASKAGDADSGNQPIEDTDFWDIGSHSMPDDPGADLSEIDYIPEREYSESGNNVNDGEESETKKYYLYVTESPISVARGSNFTFNVELQDALGNRIAQDVNITLYLTSSNPADVLSVTSAKLTNGLYTNSAMQITGGTGDGHTGRIQVRQTTTEPNLEIESAASQAFQINDGSANITWTTFPEAVVRGEEFAVGISAPTYANQYVDINLILKSDPDDVLYDSSGLVTQVLLDGSGLFSASDWYVDGGSGDGSVTIQADESGDTAATTPISLSDSEELLQIQTYPSEVVRGQPFIFSIRGPANETVTITFVTTGSDKLYNGSDIEVTTIDLDSNGEFEANDWHIEDDAGPESGVIKADFNDLHDETLTFAINDQSGVVRVQNDYGAEIPAKSAMMITSIDSNGVRHVTRPDADSLPPGIILFNKEAIPDASEGLGYSAFDEDLQVGYDSDEPDTSDDVGTQIDSFNLLKDNTGFKCVDKVIGVTEIYIRPAAEVGDEILFVPVHNDYGAEIPAYAVMEILGQTDLVYSVTRPTANSLPAGQLLFNSGTAIPIDEDGLGLCAFDAEVIANVTGTTVARGDEAGSVVDSFLVKKDNFGLIVVMPSSGGAVAVMRPFSGWRFIGAYQDDKIYNVRDPKIGLPKQLRCVTGSTISSSMERREMLNGIQYIVRCDDDGLSLVVWKSLDNWKTLIVYVSPFTMPTNYKLPQACVFLSNDACFMHIDTTRKFIKMSTTIDGVYSTVYSYPADPTNENVFRCGLFGTKAFFLSVVGWSGSAVAKELNIVYTEDGISFTKINIITLATNDNIDNLRCFFIAGGYLYVCSSISIGGIPAVVKLYRSSDLIIWEYVGDADRAWYESQPIVLYNGNLIQSFPGDGWYLALAGDNYLIATKVVNFNTWNNYRSSMPDELLNYISTGGGSAKYSLDGGVTWVNASSAGYSLLFRR